VLGEPSTLSDTNGWANLSAFSDSNCNLLLHHGIAHWFSSLDTLQYDDRLPAASGGASCRAAVSRSARIRSTRATKALATTERRELRVPLTLL
jgi:hypothetical protein